MIDGQRTTRTADDARLWVADARMGSLAGACTDDYLFALQRYVAQWAERLEEECRIRIAAHRSLEMQNGRFDTH